LSVGIPELISLVFYLVLGLYAIFTAIFYYHWNAYGNSLKVTGVTYLTYIAITVPLILIMATTALII
jgi:hypothetical protein